MNTGVLTGRLTKDAELRFIPGTGVPCVLFTLAVERKYQKDKNNKKVDYIPCEYIGKSVDKLAQYLTKGSLVSVQFELHIDNVKKQDGTIQTYTKAHVENLQLVQSKREETQYRLEPTHNSNVPF